jgi:SchA/CurD like domain
MMSNWHAVCYPIKPGSEDMVKELFRAGGRPETQIKDADGAVVGRLVSTMVFVGREKAVRLIEFEGTLATIIAHLATQPQGREFQRRLSPHLAVPRDMDGAGSAREFFRRATLECVLVRRHDQALEV